MKSIASLLLGHTRAAVLGALLLHPERSLHVRELARLTRTSAGSLHRELRMLADHGLLRREEIGRQVHYRANRESAIFTELAGLLRKTSGVADVLRDALAPLGNDVEQAFIFGSVAAGTERASSDIDVMVLGPVGFADVVCALASAQATLGREINPTVMPTRVFAERMASGDPFAESVASGARIWLTGDAGDSAEPRTDRTNPVPQSQSGRHPAHAVRDRPKLGGR